MSNKKESFARTPEQEKLNLEWLQELGDMIEQAIRSGDIMIFRRKGPLFVAPCSVSFNGNILQINIAD